MPHIHTAPGQHDHTASVYLFRTDFDQPKILLHLHKKYGKYTQFGGHIELHETPWQAIIHEMREESGYDISQLRLLQPTDRIAGQLDNSIVHPQPVIHSTHPFNAPGIDQHYHTDVAYAAIATTPPAHQPAKGESTDMQLLTKDELLALPDVQIIENVRQIAVHIFDSILGSWQPVSADEFTQ